MRIGSTPGRGGLLRGAGLVLMAMISSGVGCSGELPSLPPEVSVEIPGDGRVVVYVEAPRRVAGPVISLFRQESGIEVEAIYLDDIGEEFAPSLRREAAAGRVDVVWGESPLIAEEMVRAGLAAEFRPAIARPVPRQYRDRQFRWIGFAANPRVFIYNYRELDREKAPSSIEHIALPGFASTGAVPQIASGAQAFHAAALFTLWGEERARTFFDEAAAGGLLVLPDDKAVRDEVSSGKRRWGLIGLDEAICAKRYAQPVHIIYPDLMRRVGAVVVPQVAVLMRNAPNSDQAKGLFSYFFTRDAGWLISKEDCALITLLPGIPDKPEWVPDLNQLNVTRLDNAAIYDAYLKNADYFSSWGTTPPALAARTVSNP